MPCLQAAKACSQNVPTIDDVAASSAIKWRRMFCCYAAMHVLARYCK